MTGTLDARTPFEDEGVVERLRAGDEHVFAGLVDSWSGWMLGLARAHVPSPSVAEEVVQETWLAVLQGLAGFRGESSLRTWVFRILVNQAKRRGLRESRTVPFASLSSEDRGPTVDPDRFQTHGESHPGGWRRFPDEWPEQVALSREVRDVVMAALARVPARQRIVVTLRDLDELSSHEVCELLDISAGNQRVLLHRGRAAVREHLERYFDTVRVTAQRGGP